MYPELNNTQLTLTKKPSACSASLFFPSAPSVGSHKQALLWTQCSSGTNICPLQAWLFRSQSQDLTNIPMFLNVLLCKSKWIYSLINMPQNASLPKLLHPCRISPKPHEKYLISVLQFHPLSLSIQQTIDGNLPFSVLKRILCFSSLNKKTNARPQGCPEKQSVLDQQLHLHNAVCCLGILQPSFTLP